VAQGKTEVAKRPVRLKRNRGRAAKHALAEAAETGLSKQGSETSSDLDRPALEAEVDESHFTRVTPELVLRGRGAEPFRLAPPLAESSKAELHKSRFLSSTASLLVSKGEAKPSVLKTPPIEVPAQAEVARNQAEGELHRLQEQLAALRATLADRETALAKAALDTEQARERQQQENQAASSKVEQEWKSAGAARLAEAEARWQEQSARALGDVRAQAEAARNQAEEELHRLQEQLAVLQATLADREAALAKAALDAEQARERQQQENRAALSNVEQEWKSAGTARLTEAEVKWQEQSARALAAVRAQAEAARNQAEGELHRLQEQLAALRATLADRDTAVAKTALDAEQVRERQQQENQAALSKVEQEWKSAGAARLAEAEARWQEQSARALADVRAQAEAARNQAEEELHRLQEQLAVLQATLADRETALAKAALDAEQARERQQQENRAALSNVEQEWKSAGTARLTEAEVKWQEQSARALAEVRAHAEAARTQAEGELHRRQEQLAALRATLADRETALAKAALDTEQVRERGRQELEAALAKAKDWEAGEVARFATAEAEWRKQSVNALNEATARYQAAEGMLMQARMQADRARSDAVGGSIKSGERTRFGTRPADRETETAPIRLPSKDERGLGTEGTNLGIRSRQIMFEQEPRTPRKRTLRDVAVAASLAILAILAYPSVEPLFPESWRSNIAAIERGRGPSPGVAAQEFAAVVSDVNLRAGASTTAKVIGTLSRGLKVATIERRGDWTLVQIEGDSRDSQPRRGWVNGSFLKGETGEVKTVPAEE